jgi:hypothetical protein
MNPIKTEEALKHRSRFSISHDPEACWYCTHNYWLMTSGCVADLLGIKKSAVYSGELGTDCLRQGRAIEGDCKLWVRAQVEAHWRLMIEQGKCDGSCKKAAPNPKVRPVV